MVTQTTKLILKASCQVALRFIATQTTSLFPNPEFMPLIQDRIQDLPNETLNHWLDFLTGSECVCCTQ